ncbi:nif-specific transcriptional activator NifA [Aquisphaera insulae]|uniref:nif-specific transcriptional activator NifA n=1 Tax=Aquisphaera insulae TaxID=2712864 RepID=UPI00196ABA49|nr:nif-specific transcriptional activator NifA [Aquisphaera insulae]
MDCKDCPITLELDTLFNVSQVLAHSLDLQRTLCGVLHELQDRGGLRRGMVTLLNPDSGELILRAVHDDSSRDRKLDDIRYRSGEGIIGLILEQAETVIVPRIADEPRFISRLGLYQPDLPFIATPIRMGAKVIGVIAAQPDVSPPTTLQERARFLEMVSNLVGQVVRLSWSMAEERRHLVSERDRLLQEVRVQYGFDNIIGHTPVMRRVFEQIRAVARWTTTVLIRGESGTGKELVARAIHYNSMRAEKPFVRLNCAALSDQLLESELFGHEKGAFTGAADHRLGRFEQADGGTLFLDEIGEISPTFQAKLLRILQEGEFERVGSSKTREIDVRVIAATNRNLEDDVASGKFREDLYYRLNVMPIYMPPLRARLEDLPEIARALAGRIAKRQGRPLQVTDDAVRMMMQYQWPGNIREVENCLERAAVMAERGVIDRDALILSGLEDSILEGGATEGLAADFNDPALDERERIVAALEHAGWVQAKAARLLGMTPRQIAYRIQQFNIKVRKI